MVFAKEQTMPNSMQSPTSGYLNTATMTDSIWLTMQLNKEFLSNPTNPHLNQVYKIRLHDDVFVYYATSDNIFTGTDIGHYFRRLLKYQNISGLIDISNDRYIEIYSKYLSAIDNNSRESITYEQRQAFITVLQKVAKNINVSIENLNIQISADGELAIFRNDERGTHYILVGDSSDDISYLFVSNIPGSYSSLHLSEGANLEEILDSFSA
jgi:hypothetical protein